MGNRLLAIALHGLVSLSSIVTALPVSQYPKANTKADASISKRSLENLKTTLHGRSESGPVISSNFPDPGLISVDGVWYAYATRTIGSTVHIQVATSTDFDTWALVDNDDGSQYDALPDLPAWVNDTSLYSWATWAPYVQQIGDAGYVMYFAAVTTEDESGLYHCIGAATSSSVIGPFTGQDTSIICPLDQGGAIDPSGFQDTNGDRYIVYKVDGNSIGHGGACGNTVAPIVATPLILQPVEDDGLTFNGDATTLLNNDGASDDGIIEGPSIAVTSSGTYLLFFSSGCFTDDTYTVSYATATSVTGPYTRNSTPLFQTGTYGLTAPGSADIWADATNMVFHANNGDGVRSMYTAVITVDGDEVSA